MDAFEINKIVGATTGALMIFLVVTFGSEMMFAPHKGGDGHGEKLAYSIEIEEPEEEVAEAEDAAPAVSLASLMASADPAAGEKVFNKCKSCHVAEEGGPNRVGPALWGVMGREIASADGFTYSDALAGKGGVWDWEAMNGFLTKPADWAPGTSMGYAGLRKAEDRADLMAWLNTMTGAPIDPPADDGAAAPAPAEEAAAEAEVETASAEQAPVEEANAEETATEEAPVVEASVEAAAPAAAGGVDAELASLIAAGDADAGAKVFRKCKACHIVEEGGKNRVGPALWGVMGREIAAADGFSYSDAMAGKGGAWDWASMNAFLENPGEWLPGTKMAFAGLRKAKDRANVMTYLNENSGAPIPQPGG